MRWLEIVAVALWFFVMALRMDSHSRKSLEWDKAVLEHSDRMDSMIVDNMLIKWGEMYE